jgi:uroporphyrinogen-III synthase
MRMTALPLDGRRVIITRPEEQAGEMEAAVRQLGGIPVSLPMIRIVPVEDTTACDRALRQLERMDMVVFASANAVRFTLDRAAAIGVAQSLWSGREIYAVGGKTSECARELGLELSGVPGEFSGAALANTLLVRPLQGKRVLFPRGDIGRDEVMRAVAAAGAEVVTVMFYRTVGPGQSAAQGMRQELMGHPLSIVAFASPSAVRHFAELFTQEELVPLRSHIIAAAIGNTTRESLLAMHLPVQILANEASGQGLVSSIAQYVQSQQHT